MTQTTQRPIAIIGFGAIAQTLVDVLCDAGFSGAMYVLVRAPRMAQTQELLEEIAQGRCASVHAVTDVKALLEATPDIVVECAGHGAVLAYAETILSGGTDLVIASVGSLADSALFATLTLAAQNGNAQIILPSGAIGGIDTLAAANIAGVDRVVYTGRKPPAAWAGSPAEDEVDLLNLTGETVFFEGTAREAATRFPKNANVAATLALAGIGMDKTEVRLVADPSVSENTHEYRVISPVVDFSMKLTGKPSLLNPKTSQSTVYSLARAVLNRTGTVVI